jgi:hypothetical protein
MDWHVFFISIIISVTAQGADHSKNINCEVHKGACTQHLQGTDIILDINPKPVKAVFSGMGLMTVFGVGTIPSILMVARLSGMGWLKSREMIYKIGSILMIGIGIHFLIKGLRY